MNHLAKKKQKLKQNENQLLSIIVQKLIGQLTLQLQVPCALTDVTTLTSSNLFWRTIDNLQRVNNVERHLYLGVKKCHFPIS